MAEARPPAAAAGPSTTAAPGWSAAPTGTARTSFYLEGRRAARSPTGWPCATRPTGR
ncbi:hypothetical protein O1L55_27520 [Streptomyces albulus]|nr:hypothetical protein [Streptomyces noursei]